MSIGIKVVVLTSVVASTVAVMALGGGKAVVVPKGDLKWKNMGIPGVDAAVVTGNMEKGPCRFFLKYPVGFVSPLHSHSSDHYVTMISGKITLTAGGKSHKLGPGSYFSFTGKMAHVAKVEGNEPAVFFIQSDGPWDVVMTK